MREGGLNIMKPEDRLKEYERWVQLSIPLFLSLPEAELKQQQIIQEIKRRKRLLSDQKRR